MGVPVEVLEKLAKTSEGMRYKVRAVVDAKEPASIVKAEKSLSAEFLMTPGLGFRCGFSKAEEDALSNLSRGEGWRTAEGSAPEPEKPKFLSNEEMNKQRGL